MTARSAGASAAIIETNISTHVTVKNTAIYGVRLCGWGRGKESTVKPAVDMTLLCMYLRSIILPSIPLPSKLLIVRLQVISPRTRFRHLFTLILIMIL